MAQKALLKGLLSDNLIALEPATGGVEGSDLVAGTEAGR